MADPKVVRGGYARVRIIWTKDAAPWSNVADYNPRAEIRDRVSGAVLTTWDISYDPVDTHHMILTLPSTRSPLVTASRAVWDIMFTKPEAEEPVEALRPFWWPASGVERRYLTATSPATEPVDA